MLPPSRDELAPDCRTVLLLTECPWTARALADALDEGGLAALHARDAATLVRGVARSDLAAVIVDDGGDRVDRTSGRAATLDALETMRAAPDVPAVVLVRDAPSPGETEALHRAGAWGVVPFPLGAPTWLAQLAVWVRAGAAARDRGRRTLVDPVTGLYNGHGIAQRALEVDAAARRAGVGVASAVFSIEPIHPRADESDRSRGDDDALRVAGACRRVGRASDVFGRVGEREFVVIAPATDPSGVRAIVGRVADAVGRAPGSEALRLDVRAAAGATLAGIAELRDRPASPG